MNIYQEIAKERKETLKDIEEQLATFRNLVRLRNLKPETKQKAIEIIEYLNTEREDLKWHINFYLNIGKKLNRLSSVSES